jgi:hypothetical protein
VLGEKVIGCEGVEVWISVNARTLTGGGVVKPGVGKYSKVLGLNHGTTSGEIGVKRISPSNPRPGGEKSAGTLPKFKLWETPVDGIIGEGEISIGVSKKGW